MKDEFVGFLRTADLMLGKAVQAAREDWEGGEIILSPQRAEEMEGLMKSIRSSMKAMAKIGENFSKIARMRIVDQKSV